MDNQKESSATQQIDEQLKASGGKGNSFTFGNKEKEIAQTQNTESDLIREENRKEESSDIDPNELTDIEREKHPPTNPMGEVTSRPPSTGEYGSQPEKNEEVPKPPEPGSSESILAKLTEENQSQQKLIKILQDVISKKDREINEIKEILKK